MGESINGEQKKTPSEQVPGAFQFDLFDIKTVV